MKRIGILGAGAWGTALAIVYGRAGHDIFLFAKDDELANDIQEKRCNEHYLPGIALPSNILVTSDLSYARKIDYLFWVLPAQVTASVAQQLSGQIPKSVPIILCSKGIDSNSTVISEKSLLTNILATYFENTIMVLSGPNLAFEVAKGLPAAATLASHNIIEAQEIANALWNDFFKLYPHNDVIGVQIIGALKNVLAIATGIIIGKRLGINALASVISRGSVEIQRFALAFGALADTFLTLSAVGDIIATCAHPMSRNTKVGIALGQGDRSVILQKAFLAEGVQTAKMVFELAKTKKIPMPISNAVYNILYNNAPTDDVIEIFLSFYNLEI
ncbi:MAG: NAD(P)H-dependent glycerol-3-phosphate dehydrogenase [Alphaproteobacteria bacterium]